MAFPTKMYFSLSEISARWHIQAKIIRELHKAAQSPNPWLLGKNLLIDSGARTQHLKDLFKSHPILPRIKYRAKGYYSLSLEKLSTNS